MRSGTQRDGTVVAVFAWYCVLPPVDAVGAVASVVAVLVTVHLLLVVDGCCDGVGGVVVGFLLLAVGSADVLMCCDGARRCGAGCSRVALRTKITIWRALWRSLQC